MTPPAITFIPPGSESAWIFLVLGGLSAALLSLAKSGFGGSVGMLSLPLMIYACGGETTTAVGVLLPLLIAADYVAVFHWRGKWSWKVVAWLLPGAVTGIALAWGGLAGLGRLGAEQTVDNGMRFGVGLIAVGFVVLQAVKALRTEPLTFRPVPWQAQAAGTMMGVTSTFAHAAGPIAAMYLLPQRLGKSAYVATTVLLFWIVNQVKLVPYFHLGMINTATLGAGVALLPAIAVGGVAGYLLHGRVSPKQFAVIVYTMLAAAGLHLAITAALNLWG